MDVVETDKSVQKHRSAEEFLEDLRKRGLIKDISNSARLANLLNSGKGTYMGIDPTADFLHLGHYLGLSLLKKFMDNGYPVIILVGTLTARIGDPSFRDKTRVFDTDIEKNAFIITTQLQGLFKDYLSKKDRNGKPLLEIVDNYEIHNQSFLGDISIQKKPLNTLLWFIKEICSNFNMSEWIKRDFLFSRLKNGLTLSEALYPCLQGWDFFSLFENKNVAIQIGGSDQWGNMLAGKELIVKQEIKKMFLKKEIEFGDFLWTEVMTFPLLLDGSGKKFGKSEDNAISINNSEDEQSNPYEVMQYLLNAPDDMVQEYLLKLTNFSIEEIEHMVKDDIQLAKKKLAQEVCKDIFGEQKAIDSSLASQEIFGGLVVKKNYQDLIKFFPFLPSGRCTWADNLQLSSIFQVLGLVKSKSEFNRLAASHGISVAGVSFEELQDNNYIVKSDYVVWNEENFIQGILLVRRGKKQFGLMHIVRNEMSLDLTKKSKPKLPNK